MYEPVLSVLFLNSTLYAIIIVLCVVYLWKYIRIYYYLSKIPGPKGWPIIGNALLLRDITSVETYLKTFKENGTFFKVWAGPIPVVAVADPNILQTILKAPCSLSRGWLLHAMAYGIFKDSLLTTTRMVKWKQNRKIFNYAFSPTILNSFVPIFNAVSESLNRQLQNEVEKGKPFNVRRNFQRVAIDSICTTALGVDLNNLEMTENSYSQALDTIFITLFERVRHVWTYPEFIYNLTTWGKKQRTNLDVIWNMTNKILDEKMKSVSKTTVIDEYKNVEQPIERNPLKKPFLDFVLDMAQINPEFTIEQLKEELNTLIIGASETTPTILAYLFLVLGARQDIQQRLYEEIYRIFRNSERPVESEDLLKLKYTEMVIKETLRLYPVVAHTVREISDDIELENYKIPAGTHVLISMLGTHQNAEYWDNPMEFNSERFLKYHHPYAFLPFGGGPRNCVGAKYAMMLMKVVTVNTLRKYQIYTPLKLDQLSYKIDLGLRLMDGHWITVRKRLKEVDN